MVLKFITRLINVLLVFAQCWYNGLQLDYKPPTTRYTSAVCLTCIVVLACCFPYVCFFQNSDIPTVSMTVQCSVLTIFFFTTLCMSHPFTVDTYNDTTTQCTQKHIHEKHPTHTITLKLLTNNVFWNDNKNSISANTPEWGR